MTWAVGTEFVRKCLEENPGMKRAVRGGFNSRGGYSVALAIRFDDIIVDRVFELEAKPGIEFRVIGILEAIEAGTDPNQGADDWQKIYEEGLKSDVLSNTKPQAREDHSGGGYRGRASPARVRRRRSA